MTDSRPVMSDEAFAAAAAYRDPRWWMTGEGLIHVAAVMGIDGWNRYGDPGHQRLTPAQRTLMMWSDIVGQVSNGGFVQYCDNYAADLGRGVAAVAALDWPELAERFWPAMAEQAGDAAAPHRAGPIGLDDDPDKWRASRARLIRHLARRHKKWWQPVTRADLAWVESRHEEWQLGLKYQQLVLSGELASGGERVFDQVDLPDEEASAFDDWMYLDTTRAASATYVHAFILRHRDQLYRPV